MDIQKAYNEWKSALATIAKFADTENPMTKVVLNAETVLVVNSVLDRAIALVVQSAIASSEEGQKLVAEANEATQNALSKMMGKAT